jgi:hypothetical protein
LYFKEHRQQYYEELNAVRDGGDYERWIDVFAEAIRHSAEVAIETGRRVTQAFREDRAQLRAVPRIAGSLLMIQEALQAKPVATVATLRAATGLTTPTINSLKAAAIERVGCSYSANTRPSCGGVPPAASWDQLARTAFAPANERTCTSSRESS